MISLHFLEKMAEFLFLVVDLILCIPGGFRDVLAFSHLTVVRMALWHVWQALLLWFASSPPPSVDSVGRVLGVSGSSHGPLHDILHCAVRHEARLAVHQQEGTTCMASSKPMAPACVIFAWVLTWSMNNGMAWCRELLKMKGQGRS